MLGVPDRALGAPFAETLRRGGVQRALVVCGKENLDEVSCAGETWAWDLAGGRITERVLHPAQFGLGTHALADVCSGDAAANAGTLTALLKGRGETPLLEFVLLNAAAALVVAGVAVDDKDGVRLARESIASGAAWKALEAFRESGQTTEKQ